MLSPLTVRFALHWAPLLVIIVQVILSDGFPSNKRRSASMPISYRLDAWSQYDNPEEGTDREGDIFESTPSRKTMTRDPHLLWEDGLVHYYVDASIVNEPAKHAVLDDAMETIQENTCVKFVRIYPEDGEFPQFSWVNITGDQRGCFSDLGRSPAGPSVLNLDIERCFRTRGHALHELLHTLGVYHEHMRPDRDEFINILWDNIKEGDAFNFRVLDSTFVTNYDLPYDYDSVMHYSMTAFSKDRGIPTIVPMKEDIDIGQRNHLSSQDIRKLLITYNCENANEVLAYPDSETTHSHRLEILNLNSSAVVKEADNIVDDQSDEMINVPESSEELYEDNMIQRISGCLCPCNVFFYFFRLREYPRCSNCYHNYYHPIQ